MVEEVERSPTDDIEEVSASPQKGLPIGSLIRMVRRNILVISSISGVIIGAAVVANSNATPTYEGSFRLLVEPATTEGRISDPTVLTRTDGGVPSRDLISIDYPTQIEVLRSPAVLESVYDRIQERYPDLTYEEFVMNLVVQRTGTNLLDATKVLEIRYQGSESEMVLFVLEQLAERYLKYSLEERKTRISEGVRFIEDQLPDLQKRVEDLQEQVQILQQQHDLIDPGSQGQQLFGDLRNVADQQVETQRLLQEQQTLYDTLQAQLQLTPEEAIAASALSDNPRYQNLLNDLQAIESQIALESTRFSDVSPTVQRLQERRDSLTALLQQEASQILGENLQQNSVTPEVLAFQNSLRMGLIQQLVETTNQIQVLQSRLQSLNQNRLLMEQQAEEFPVVARRYNELQRQLSIATRTLDQLLMQRETLRVEAAQDQLPWEVLAEPTLPRDLGGNPMPISAGSKKQLLMGLVAGVGLGLGAALLIEKSRNIFYDADDLKDTIPAPFLGEVPFEPALAMPYPFLLQNIPGEFADAFDNIFASLSFLEGSSSVRSLVVSSACAGDGKSTVARYLAETAAQAGQRVLLVDANLRSPQLHQQMIEMSTPGLSDFLRQKAPIETIIRPVIESDRLFVITAGSAMPGANRLLASPQMAALNQKVQEHFDLVIYDAPHLSGLVDASFLAAQTNGLLMVVWLHQTARSAMQTALEQVKHYHLPIVGTVAIAPPKRQFLRKPPSNPETEEIELLYPDLADEVEKPIGGRFRFSFFRPK